MTRTSLDGQPIATLADTPTLTVRTRVPTKYLLVDTETGQIYKGQTNSQYHWALQSQSPELVTQLLKDLAK